MWEAFTRFLWVQKMGGIQCSTELWQERSLHPFVKLFTSISDSLCNSHGLTFSLIQLSFPIPYGVCVEWPRFPKHVVSKAIVKVNVSGDDYICFAPSTGALRYHYNISSSYTNQIIQSIMAYELQYLLQASRTQGVFYARMTQHTMPRDSTQQYSSVKNTERRVILDRSIFSNLKC